jgi:hypothetical protein
MAMRCERFARSVDFKRSRHLCVYARASHARSAVHSMRLWFAGIAVAPRHSLHRLCNDASVATAHEHTISAARRHGGTSTNADFIAPPRPHACSPFARSRRCTASAFLYSAIVPRGLTDNACLPA